MTVFSPLVIGPPRSGFALLCSVLAHLQPLGRSKGDLRRSLLGLFVERLGNHVSDSIAASVAAQGLADELLYNGNFRRLTGGPRWAGTERPGRACYRKSIGIRGGGDVSLLISHPLALLHTDAVTHSHSDPAWWPEATDFAGYTLHASLRHPVAMVVSSCLSLNALASEYIQRFLPTADEEKIRRELALYKLSDRRFFEAMVRFYVSYLREFLSVRHRYAVMQWEDLIVSPVETIRAVAEAAGTPVSGDHAGQIWAQIGHRNLTGDHRHNYRAGAGAVGDWRHWLTNHHLDWMRGLGLEAISEALGYGPFGAIGESGGTEFQRDLSDLVRRGEAHRPAVDDDLFGFAFNKSNIDPEPFSFRSQAWRQETRIERSTLADPALEPAISDAAEQAALRLNRLFEDVLGLRLESQSDAQASLHAVQRAHAPHLRPHSPQRYDATFEAARALIAQCVDGAGRLHYPPLPARGRPGYKILGLGRAWGRSVLRAATRAESGRDPR